MLTTNPYHEEPTYRFAQQGGPVDTPLLGTMKAISGPVKRQAVTAFSLASADRMHGRVAGSTFSRCNGPQFLSLSMWFGCADARSRRADQPSGKEKPSSGPSISPACLHGRHVGRRYCCAHHSYLLSLYPQRRHNILQLSSCARERRNSGVRARRPSVLPQLNPPSALPTAPQAGALPPNSSTYATCGGNYVSSSTDRLWRVWRVQAGCC